MTHTRHFILHLVYVGARRCCSPFRPRSTSEPLECPLRTVRLIFPTASVATCYVNEASCAINFLHALVMVAAFKATTETPYTEVLLPGILLSWPKLESVACTASSTWNAASNQAKLWLDSLALDKTR